MPPLDASPAPTVLGEIQPTPRKPRGRPRKPTHKTPVDITEFDAVAATIRSIPGAIAPTVRERARQLAGQDARLSRGPLVLLNRLIDADWATGIYTKSLAQAGRRVRPRSQHHHPRLQDAGRGRLQPAPHEAQDRDWDTVGDDPPHRRQGLGGTPRGGRCRKIRG